MNRGFRQANAWLHGWVGLIVGWLAYVICLSGTLSILKPEISRWMRPETVAVAAPADAVAAAARWLSVHAATAPAWFLTPPDGRANTVTAAWFDQSAPGGYRIVALDPLTGAPVARETLGGEFFYRLHFELQLPYPWGRWLASLAAAFLLVAIVSGIIAHRRFFSDMFTLRTGKGQRSWLDAHNLGGVVALPFHLMIVYSGLVTLATLTMPSAILSAYGGDTAKLIADVSPGQLDRPKTGRPAPLVPLAPMLRTAEARFGESAGSVAIVNPGDAAATVTVIAGDFRQLARQPATIVFDGASGRPVRQWIERRPAHVTYDVMYGLHMGRFAAGLLRWLYLLCGLALTATVASGLILWVTKRRQKGGGAAGHEAVARANNAMIFGTPIAFAAFFLANRLLPVGLAGRAGQEVAAVFWCWGAVLLVGLALPSARGARWLTGGAAAAWALVALLGLAQATAGPIFLWGSVLMALAAAGFAWPLRASPSAAPRRRARA